MTAPFIVPGWVPVGFLAACVAVMFVWQQWPKIAARRAATTVRPARNPGVGHPHRPPGDRATNECTCYLGDPDDPTRDQEACAACDREFWENPIYMMEGDA